MLIDAAPVLLIPISPDTATGLKFVPSATIICPEVLVPIVISSPETVRSPEIVKLPPELSDIFSLAASEAAVLKLNFVALFEELKSPSDTAAIPAATSMASVPVVSSGA